MQPNNIWQDINPRIPKNISRLICLNAEKTYQNASSKEHTRGLASMYHTAQTTLQPKNIDLHFSYFFTVRVKHPQEYHFDGDQFVSPLVSDLIAWSMRRVRAIYNKWYVDVQYVVMIPSDPFMNQLPNLGIS